MLQSPRNFTTFSFMFWSLYPPKLMRIGWCISSPECKEGGLARTVPASYEVPTNLTLNKVLEYLITFVPLAWASWVSKCSRQCQESYESVPRAQKLLRWPWFLIILQISVPIKSVGVNYMALVYRHTFISVIWTWFWLGALPSTLWI